MFRLILAGTLALTMLLATSHFAPRIEAHTGYWRVAQTAGEGLRLRTGPSGEYRIIEVMARGDRLKAFGHRGNWIKVRHLATGSVGWASLTYVVADSGPASGGSGFCMTNYFGEYSCASPNIADAIRYWFGQYGIGAWWGFATASCESSFDLYAYNPASGVTGLFQFQPSTFWAWGGHDLYDPWDQSRIAAKMFANGAGDQFYCAVLQGW